MLEERNHGNRRLGASVTPMAAVLGAALCLVLAFTTHFKSEEAQPPRKKAPEPAAEPKIDDILAVEKSSHVPAKPKRTQAGRKTPDGPVVDLSSGAVPGGIPGFPTPRDPVDDYKFKFQPDGAVKPLKDTLAYYELEAEGYALDEEEGETAEPDIAEVFDIYENGDEAEPERTPEPEPAPPARPVKKAVAKAAPAKPTPPAKPARPAPPVPPAQPAVDEDIYAMAPADQPANAVAAPAASRKTNVTIPPPASRARREEPAPARRESLVRAASRPAQRVERAQGFGGYDAYNAPMPDWPDDDEDDFGSYHPSPYSNAYAEAYAESSGESTLYNGRMAPGMPSPLDPPARKTGYGAQEGTMWDSPPPSRSRAAMRPMDEPRAPAARTSPARPQQPQAYAPPPPAARRPVEEPAPPPAKPNRPPSPRSPAPPAAWVAAKKSDMQPLEPELKPELLDESERMPEPPRAKASPRRIEEPEPKPAATAAKPGTRLSRLETPVPAASKAKPESAEPELARPKVDFSEGKRQPAARASAPDIPEWDESGQSASRRSGSARQVEEETLEEGMRRFENLPKATLKVNLSPENVGVPQLTASALGGSRNGIAGNAEGSDMFLKNYNSAGESQGLGGQNSLEMNNMFQLPGPEPMPAPEPAVQGSLRPPSANQPVTVRIGGGEAVPEAAANSPLRPPEIRQTPNLRPPENNGADEYGALFDVVPGLPQMEALAQ